MKSLSSFLRIKGDFAQGVLTLTLGTLIAQAIGVVAVPLLTRIYTPQEFGHYQIFVSLLGVATVLSTLRLDLAIPLPDQAGAAFRLVAAGLLSTVGTALLTYGMATVLGWRNLMPASLAPLSPYAGILSLSILGVGSTQILTSWAMREKAYTASALSKITQLSTQSGLQLGLGGLARLGLPGLLLGDALGRLAYAFAMVFSFRSRWTEFIRSCNPSLIGQTLVRYRRFPLISTGAGLISTISLSIPALFFERYYGAQVLGWVAVPERLLCIPLSLVGQSLAQAYLGEAARLIAADPAALRTLYVQLLRRVALIGFLPCLLLVVAGPQIFSLTLGESWSEAGSYSRYLSVMYYVAFLASPFMATLNVLEHQSLQFTWEFARGALVVMGLWGCGRYGATARQAVMMYCATLGVSYLSYLFISAWAIKKRIRSARSVPGST